MATWKPTQAISPKEMVGRRAFGSKVFSATDQKSVLRYRITVFLDNQQDTGLSVDRLGIKRADGKVLALLCPLCDTMANKRATSFKGWAQIHAADLKGRISRTPAIGENNPYHAEIDRSKYNSKETRRSLAFELCVHASKHKFIDRALVSSDESK